MCRTVSQTDADCHEWCCELVFVNMNVSSPVLLLTANQDTALHSLQHSGWNLRVLLTQARHSISMVGSSSSLFAPKCLKLIEL